MKFNANIATFFVGPFGSAILSALTLPLLAWMCLPEDIGRYAILQVAIGLSVIVFSLGLDQAYTREFHELAPAERSTFFWRTFRLPFLIQTSLLVVALVLAPDQISVALFSIPSLKLSMLAALCFSGALATRFLALVLRMHEKGFLFSLSQILPKLVFLLCCIVSLKLNGTIGFSTIASSLAIASVSVSIIFIFISRAELRGKVDVISEGVDQKSMIRLLMFGLPLVVAGAASWGVFGLDRIILKRFSGFTELGIYSMAASIGAAAGVVSSVFNILWAPTAYKWKARGVPSDKYDMVTEQTLAAIVIVFGVAGCLSGLIRFVLPAAYDGVEFIIPACLAAPLFYTLSEASSVGIGIARRSHYSMFSSVIALICGLFLWFLLIPNFGGTGAAVSTALTVWIFFVLRTEFSCIAWRKQPRTRLYASTAIIILYLSGYAFFGKGNEAIWLAAWIAFLIVSSIAFHRIYSGYLSLLKASR